jgi:hypothetical protein
MRQSHKDRIEIIKAKLAQVEGQPPWKYNPEHEMFVGTTNMLEMYDRMIDLGRFMNGEPDKNKLTESLGQFLEKSREDMAFLLWLLEEKKESDPQISTELL